jgi:hypothetical protein
MSPPPPLALGRMEITSSHEVEFYPDDATFVGGVTRFIEAALESGNAVCGWQSNHNVRAFLRAPAPQSRAP